MKTASEWIVRTDGRDVRAKVHAVKDVLRDVGFCVIRGVFPSDDVLAEYERMASEFDRARDIRRSGPIVPDMPDFQRLDCGDYGGINARFCRTLARFFWNPPTLFRRHFERLRELRDWIGDRRVEYHRGYSDVGGRRYYEMPKILQYPLGGGFLNTHYDGSDNYGVINIGMSITTKGRHFTAGGVFYKYRDGEECLIEDVLEPGDVYVHDEGTYHGVHAIDPQADIDLARFGGRVNLILSSQAFDAA